MTGENASGRIHHIDPSPAPGLGKRCVCGVTWPCPTFLLQLGMATEEHHDA